MLGIQVNKEKIETSFKFDISIIGNKNILKKLYFLL